MPSFCYRGRALGPTCRVADRSSIEALGILALDGVDVFQCQENAEQSDRDVDQPFDKGPVSGHVGLCEVVEQSTTTADEQQQSTTAVVVMLVFLEVLSECRDSMRQDRNLNFGASGIAFSGGVFGDELGLCCSVD